MHLSAECFRGVDHSYGVETVHYNPFAGLPPRVSVQSHAWEGAPLCERGAAVRNG